MTDAGSRLQAGRWLLLLALLATVALRWPLLDVPLERDEGEYAYIAWRMDQGDVPYRDAFDQKPPGVFAAYWLTFRLLGDSVRDIHLGLLLWTLASVLAVYAVGRRIGKRTASDDAPNDGSLVGGFAALAFGVASSSPALLAQAANTEIYMVLPMTLSLLSVLRGMESERGRDWLLAGFFGMAAFWFKQVAATSGLCLLLAACALPGSLPGLATRVQRCLWMAAGTLLAILPVVLSFIAQDAWPDFLDAVFLHNLAYVQSTDTSAGFSSLAHALRSQAPEFWALWALGLLAIAHPTARKAAAWPIAWSLFLLLGVCSGFYFREHYFIQWLPGMALLAGLGSLALLREFQARSAAGRGLIPGIALVSLLLLMPPGLARLDLLSQEPADIARRLYGANPFAESQLIADFIASRSEAEEKIFVLGSEPQILFLARRASATKYIFTYPLTGGYPDSEERQREALAQFEAVRPRYVVDVNIPTSHLMAPGVPLPLFEGLNEAVAARYRLEAMFYLQKTEGLFRQLNGRQAERFIERNTDVFAKLSSVCVYRRNDP